MRTPWELLSAAAMDRPLRHTGKKGAKSSPKIARSQGVAQAPICPGDYPQKLWITLCVTVARHPRRCARSA
jgi:hypothetical protein